MRFATTASALIALSVSAIAQDPQTWDDASAPAVSTATAATTTITKTLSLVHTETVYGASSSSSTSVSVASQASSVAAESTTEVGAAPVATPTGISGAATMSRDVVFAVIAAGAVAFWTS